MRGWGLKEGLRSPPKLCLRPGVGGAVFWEGKHQCEGWRPLFEVLTLDSIRIHVPVRNKWPFPTLPLQASPRRRGCQGFWSRLVPPHHQGGYNSKSHRALSLVKSTLKTTYVVLSWSGFPHPLTPASSPPDGPVIMVIPVVPTGPVVQGHTPTSPIHRSRKCLLAPLRRQSHRLKAGSALHQVSALHLLLAGTIWSQTQGHVL